MESVLYSPAWEVKGSDSFYLLYLNNLPPGGFGLVTIYLRMEVMRDNRYAFF